MITQANAIEWLQQLFQHLISAASATGKLDPFIPAQKPAGRVIVVGAGKAAAAMAAEWERIWPENYPALEGMVITRYGHGQPTKHIQVTEASHPLPDQAGYQAAQQLLTSVTGLNAHDQVFFLVSGGASALTTLPAADITLADKRQLNRQLLHCGAPIEAINTIRKHLSRFKGGRLALAAAPAKITTLAISDVIGNDISSIGSGAAVADPTTLQEVWQIVRQYQLTLPDSIRRFLQHPEAETPKQLHNSQAHIIVTADQAFQTIEQQVTQQGLQVLYLGDRIDGEAREVAKVMAGIAQHLRLQVDRTGLPMLLLSGGETTVTLKKPQGRGGRNSEFLLALAIALNSAANIYALAADTDGIDGSEDNAGAWITPQTLNQAQSLGLNPQESLQQHQSYDFFAGLQQLLLTGPTRTNINDFRALLILPSSAK